MTAIAAVDIGGTKIAAGLVTADHLVHDRRQAPTPATAGPAAVLATAADLLRAVIDEGRRRGAGFVPVAVGVATAGVVDADRGTIVSATGALPGWAGTAVGAQLSTVTGLPVRVENDVNAFALAEATAAGVGTVIAVAVGTGVGGGLVIDGRLVRGAHWSAAELGHVPAPGAEGLPCPCGGVGHVEAVASGPALTARYRDLTSSRVTDALASRSSGLAEVAAAAGRGDPFARQVLATGGTVLGRVLGGLANVLDPDLIVLGGGVARCGPPFLDPLRHALHAELLPAVRRLTVRTGALGDDAHLLGAAAAARGGLDVGR